MDFETIQMGGRIFISVFGGSIAFGAVCWGISDHLGLFPAQIQPVREIPRPTPRKRKPKTVPKKEIVYVKWRSYAAR